MHQNIASACTLTFLMFINELTDKTASTIRLFADDVSLYSIINYIEDCYTLQGDFEYFK